jgi:hypothetical protein
MNVAAKRALEEIENGSKRTQEKNMIMSRIAHVSTGLCTATEEHHFVCEYAETNIHSC